MNVDWRLKQNNKQNVINFSTKSESKKHYLRKSEVCYYLKLFPGINIIERKQNYLFSY